MKVLFGVVVLAVAFQSSQCESLERDRAVGDIRFRNPFNLRQFTGLHRIVGGIDGWFCLFFYDFNKQFLLKKYS